MGYFDIDDVLPVKSNKYIINVTLSRSVSVATGLGEYPRPLGTNTPTYIHLVTHTSVDSTFNH